MAEYIKREAAIKAIEKADYTLIANDADSCKADYLREIIESVPAADVVPVVHGRWIEKTVPEGCRYFECSNCGAQENRHTAIKGYYCWRCGAKMDGGAVDEV